MKNILPTMLGLAFFVFAANAQEDSFGKISESELMEKAYPADSSATAAVLYRQLNVRFEYVSGDGFHVITHVHERIKIYTSEGFEYATIKQNLYKSQSEEESLSNLKGFTYTLENGEVVRSKLKGSDTFKKSLNKYYDQETFTMPNVKEGSIVEYQYRLDSPFAYSIDEIILQYDIPIKRQEISVAVPEYYYFKPAIKGYLHINPTFSNTGGRISRVEWFQNNARYDTRSLDYRVTTTSVSMADVPALVEEPFVNDMDNYRSAINYELQYVQFPQSARKDYTGSWESVIKTIYKNDNFGRQLSYDKFFSEQLGAILGDALGNEEKLARIYTHVQGHMNWNGYLGYRTDNGVREAYESRSGNIGDINLLLTGFLKAAGFKARPVLISTRDNGIPIFPTLEGFNYVIASVALNGKEFFLDASNKYASPGILPTRALNWHGTLVQEDGTYQLVPLMPGKHSKEIQIMNLELLEDGSVKGKNRTTYTGYKAYDFRNSYNGMDENEYLDALESRNQGLEISEYTIDNKETAGAPLIEEFDFTIQGQLQSAPDKLLFQPLMHKAMHINPFRLDSREYPVDYTYPREVKYMYNIVLPPGYEVQYLPKGAKVLLPENLGSFSYQLKDLGSGALQLLVDLQINQAIIPAMYYPMLKEFYKNIVEKQAERVVLSKSMQHEYSERTAGGR